MNKNPPLKMRCIKRSWTREGSSDPRKPVCLTPQVVFLQPRYLEGCHPQSLLALGADAAACVSVYRAADANNMTGMNVASVVQTDARYDAAILMGCIEHMDKKAALALIARLRDAQAKNLLVGAPLGSGLTGQRSHWTEQDFLALGMQVYQRLDCAAAKMILCCYNLHDYKQVPDWLNSKYWAHPERWEF